MLEKERGIKPHRYAHDVIWPTLALRELAAGELTVSPKELDEAYDGEFGPSVRVRLIAIEDPERARQVHAQATAKPEEFPALAKKYSKDINSASAYGLIQPIRHRVGRSAAGGRGLCPAKGRDFENRQSRRAVRVRQMRRAAAAAQGRRPCQGRAAVARRACAIANCAAPPATYSSDCKRKPRLST